MAEKEVKNEIWLYAKVKPTEFQGKLNEECERKQRIKNYSKVFVSGNRNNILSIIPVGGIIEEQI